MFLPIKRHNANDFTINVVVGFFLPQRKKKKDQRPYGTL